VNLTETNFNFKNKTSKKAVISPKSNLEAKITKIDMNGIVTIKFSKVMNFTSNLTLFREKDSMSLLVEFRAIQKPNMLIDNWKVIDVGADSMIIQVKFPDEKEIS